MKLQELMQNISAFSIPNYLVFFGEEQKIIDDYITQIRNSIEHTYIYCNSVQAVLNITRRKALVKKCRIFVVIDDFDFTKNEQAWEIVKNQFIKSNDFLILRFNKLNKKEAFYKNNQQNCVQFSKLSTEVLYLYVSRILPDFDEDNINRLIEYCGNDYGRILLECDKIKQYQGSHIVCKSAKDIYIPTADNCFNELNEQGLFHKEIGDITFELTDAVLAGYTDKAILKLDEAKRNGESPLQIIGILYNGFRNLLAYQGLGKDKTNAMERTGMTKGELWGCNKNKGGYNIGELRRNTLICQRVEVGIKSGTIDEDIALDYVVLSCLA